jgi:hypothetical protein
MTIIYLIFLSAAPWATYCGQYQGIRAYSNGYPSYYGPYDTYSWRYLCIEWVNRFYAQVFPHQNMSWVYAAYDYYDSYHQVQLDRYPNGGIEPPRPGDLLCSDGGQWGHVAIVREVGSNYIKLIQQNWYQDGRDSAMVLSLTIANGHYTLAPFSSVYPIQGWLRKPGLTLADLTCCEDNSAACARFGTAGRWHEFAFDTASAVKADSSIGVSRQHLWWVYNNGSARDNYAVWRPSLPRSGRYDIYAFIPSIRATTRHARYEIHHADGTDTAAVNQNDYYGILVVLGSNFRFNAGTDGYVLLGDDTGEDAGSTMVAFDNILFVDRGSVAVSEPAGNDRSLAAALWVEPNPFAGWARIPGREQEQFALYDPAGRCRGIYPGGRIGEGLEAGVYFVRPVAASAPPVRIVKIR